MNYGGYNIDDFDSNPSASYDKIRNIRKGNNATSTQQVIICLLTIKKFKYFV